MGPAAAIRTCLGKSFDFSGRASRSEYWWFLPVGTLLPIGALAVAQSIAPDLSFPWQCMIFFVSVLPLMAVTRRRLRDGGEDPISFETPLIALIWCMISGWSIVQIYRWASALIDAGADGPAGFGVALTALLGIAVLVPIFALQFCTGLVTGIALFGQMAAPPTVSSQKTGSKRNR
jgi:uncharacterized membrane protein YhaH (DUF805 family)